MLYFTVLFLLFLVTITLNTQQISKLDKIMATIQELIQQVDELQISLDTEQEQIATAIAGLEQSISDLQALVAEGGTSEQRQALADKLAAIKQDLEGTIPDAEPEPEPEV